jgi:CDP-glucose 4,6-dehydratase
VNPEFWRAKRVLLTGHTGFKGAWAALWLERLGATVTGFALAPETEPNLFALAQGGLSLESRIGDLADASAVAAAVEAADPEIVLHFAAQAIVRRSYESPVETFAANVMGTAHLLDALRRSEHLQSVLVVTSDKAYANRESGAPFTEADPLGGDDPYSASKAAAEMATNAWARSYFDAAGVAVACARAGNVIGGGDWAADRLIPDIWRADEAGRAPVLRYPDATRPWQHVLDPLAGYLSYAERLAGDAGGALPRALNFGPDDENGLPVAAIAERMQDALGSTTGWRHDPAPQPPEKHILALNADAAKQALDWQPKLAIAEALAWTAEWYRVLAEGGDAAANTSAQIERYEAL